MKLSVVIPAHNRPALLDEAIASVEAQDHADWEIVLVDDGSQPPIDTAPLAARLGARAVCVRHETAKGIARAKNAGIAAASGEVILILDDDDLLAPGALMEIQDAFTAQPDLDCLFMGVEPFGPQSANAARNRQVAVAKVVAVATRRDAAGRYHFDDRLFGALLQTVPIDFQRPAARRGAWNMVGGFDEAGLFSESGWAIRAATRCRVALATRVMNRWRLHGHNFGALGSAEDAQGARLRALDNGLAGAQALVDHFRGERDMVRERLRLAEARLSDNHFDKAFLLLGTNRAAGAKALLAAFMIRPRLKHAKLMARYLARSLLPFAPKP